MLMMPRLYVEAMLMAMRVIMVQRVQMTQAVPIAPRLRPQAARATAKV